MHLRIRLALGVSAILATFVVASPTMAAVGNPYSDGDDRAVRQASPDDFRLRAGTLEPGCFLARELALEGHIDIGDDIGSTHVFVPTFLTDFSIDQVLVSGDNSGYRIYNTFDTGSINNDADIDPTQNATNLDPLEGDTGVDTDSVIVCVSDHEDSGQNEPYVSDGLPGEVAALNRPVIQPVVSTLGQGALNGIARTYRMGLGYTVESWYSEYTINDTPPFTLDWTDPMAGLSNPDGSNTPSHVLIPPRIAGPVFSSTRNGPGVLRVNDVDVAGEDFSNPHFERANHGQTDVFNVAGDEKSFTLGALTQGSFPVKWTVKSSLATVDSMRDVEFTSAMFDEWEQGWQDYYCGKGSHPDLPLTPGTNSPDPRGECPVVNQPESAPLPIPAVNVTVTPAPTAAAPAAPAASSACQGYRLVRFSFSKKATAGKIRYNGKTVNAKMRDGRLRASAKLFGANAASPSAKTRIVKMTKINGSWKRDSSRYKICA